jgi:NADH dehydrogenase (ubiquinone) Fe-S protein 3
MSNNLSNFLVLVLKRLGFIAPFIIYQKNTNEECSLVVSSEFLISLVKILKHHIGYQYEVLSCVSGVDLLLKQHRFLISYELLSIRYNSRLRIKVFANSFSLIPSIVPVFINANWWEREIWDLFGVFFVNHPDLRRLLTDYGFEGHPLRKDFPLIGFNELRYDNNSKSIIYEPVSLSQEFRAFNYETSW